MDHTPPPPACEHPPPLAFCALGVNVHVCGVNGTVCGVNGNV